MTIVVTRVAVRGVSVHRLASSTQEHWLVILSLGRIHDSEGELIRCLREQGLIHKKLQYTGVAYHIFILPGPVP